MFKNLKIKKELKLFKEFKKTYVFEFEEFAQKGKEIFWKDKLVCDGEGNTQAGGDGFVNAGYKLKSPMSKTLSNLFPYNFVFRGQKLCSIEGVFQALKYKNKKMQKCGKVIMFSALPRLPLVNLIP